MADNIAITAGSGTSVKTDQVGSDHYQVVKLADGTADASGVIAADIGVKANALRVAPANDITDATYIGDIKFGEALPAGSAAIGKLAANTGVDIGDVDVTSIAAGDNNIGNVDIVSGTVTTVSTVTNLAQLGGQAVSMGTGVRDVGTQRVTIATNDAVPVTDNAGALTVDNGGTFAVQVDGSALTALQLIDNCISGSEAQVDVVAALPTGTNIIGAVKRDVVNYTPINKYYTNAGAVTDGIIWSPASGKKWVITDIMLNISAAATVTIENDLAGGDSAIMKFELAANGGVSTNFQTPWVGTEDDADLIITTSAGNVYVMVSGYEID